MKSIAKGSSEDRKKAAKKPRNRKFKPIKLKVSRLHKPDDLDLEEWQRLLRQQFAEQQSFQIRNTGEHPIFSEFSLTNPLSGKTYKTAIRGEKPGDNYCSSLITP